MTVKFISLQVLLSFCLNHSRAIRQIDYIFISVLIIMCAADIFIPQSRKPLSYYAGLPSTPSELPTTPPRPIPIFTIPSTPVASRIPKRSEIKSLKQSSWRMITSPTFKTVVIWSVYFLMLNATVTILSNLFKGTDQVILQYVRNMTEELKEELLVNQQAKMEEFEKELKLLKAKAKLVENFNEQVLSQRNEQEQLRQDLHQFHLDFFGIVNAKMKEFNKRALYQHSKFKLLSKLES